MAAKIPGTDLAVPVRNLCLTSSVCRLSPLPSLNVLFLPPPSLPLSSHSDTVLLLPPSLSSLLLSTALTTAGSRVQGEGARGEEGAIRGDLLLSWRATAWPFLPETM